MEIHTISWSLSSYVEIEGIRAISLWSLSTLIFAASPEIGREVEGWPHFWGFPIIFQTLQWKEEDFHETSYAAKLLKVIVSHYHDGVITVPLSFRLWRAFPGRASSWNDGISGHLRVGALCWHRVLKEWIFLFSQCQGALKNDKSQHLHRLHQQCCPETSDTSFHLHNKGLWKGW